MFDKSQVNNFIDSLVGWETVGIDGNGDECTRPISPVSRSFVAARLGDNTPYNGYQMFIKVNIKQANAMSVFLREMADSIDEIFSAQNGGK